MIMGNEAKNSLPNLPRKREDAQYGEWQPTETAPKDGTRLLLWATGAFNGCVVGRYSSRANNRGGGWLADRFVISKPSHWMPLPDPPITSEQKG